MDFRLGHGASQVENLLLSQDSTFQGAVVSGTNQKYVTGRAPPLLNADNDNHRDDSKRGAGELNSHGAGRGLMNGDDLGDLNLSQLVIGSGGGGGGAPLSQF